MIFYGSKELVEDDYLLDFTPGTGQTWTRRYRGGFDEIAAAYNSAVAAGLRARMDSQGNGYWSLVVTYAGGTTSGTTEILSDLWELVGNDLEKSIWELPSVQTELNKITSEPTLAKLRSWIESFVGGQYIVQDSDGTEINLTLDKITDLASGLDLTVIRNLITSLSRGTEAYAVSQFVLRNTKIVPRNSILKPAYTNLNKMLTAATLVSSENIPSTILFNIPDGGYWLKKSPTCTQVNAERFQFQQEWWHADDYDRSIYGAPL